MRRKYWIFALIAALLVVGDGIYWRFAAERLRDGLKAWLADRVSQGWEVGSGPLAIGGWPGAASVTVPNLTMRHAGLTLPGELVVGCAQVTLWVSLLNPTTLRISPDGPMHVQGGNAPDVAVTADQALVSVPLGANGPLSVVLHAAGLRLQPATGAWRAGVGLLNAQTDITNAVGGDQTLPTAIFSLTSEAIALPDSVRWPLGANISSLSLTGVLSGKLPRTRDITRWAEDWRDGGGSLEVRRLAVGWGPLGLASSATLALDDQLQPMGSGSGRIVGYAATLDRLAAGGVMTKSAATAAKAVLSLMAGTTDADEPSSVDVPLTLQYRTLSMRQVPLVRLPELDWPRR